MRRIIERIKAGGQRLRGVPSYSKDLAISASEVVKGDREFQKPKIIKIFIVGFLIAFCVLELVFSVSAYGFHSKDPLTKFFANVFQLPAIYSSYGTITISELEHNKDYVLHFYRSTNQAEIDENELQNQVEEQLIENQIVRNAAAKYKIRLTREEEKSAIDQIIGENGGEEEVSKVLDELYGLNLKQFKKLVKAQLLREKINNDVIERVKVKHILLRLNDGADETQINEVHDRAVAVRSEIISGLDFSEAAKKYSEDVGSNESGGDLPSFARGEMVKEFEDAAFSTPIGDITEPVKTSFGWHIILVEDKSGVIDNSFENWVLEQRENIILLKIY